VSKRAMAQKPPLPLKTPVPWRVWLGIAGLAILVAVVYEPTLTNGFIWDDESYLEENPTLQSVEGLRDIWFQFGATPQYYPLVFTSFWVERHLWGLFPAGYHAVNLALHACSAMLIWLLLSRLRVPGGWLAAAIFAVHPVEVESVAWIAERKNVLSCALALASILAYLAFAPVDESTAEASRRPAGLRRYYLLAFALFVGALLSKTVTASVPAVLLVIQWWKQGTIRRADVARLAPFFVIGLAFSVVTVWLERTHVGAEGEAWNLSAVDRILIAGRALWFYAGKLAWPHPLAFFYPRWTIDPGQWWQYLFPAAACAVFAGLWLARGRIGRGPLAAVLIFAGVLTPALGFFNVYPFLYSFVADHFQYHASIALIALAASGVAIAHRRAPGALRYSIPLAACALLGTLGVVARERTVVFHDLATLYENTIARNPEAWAAHVNLGYYLQQHGAFGEAVDHYRQALAINPKSAPVHIRLGTALYLSGKTAEVIAEFERALAADLSDFNRSIAHVHYGIVLNAECRFDEAAEHFKKAIELRPSYFAALFNYGIALDGRGETEEAMKRVRAALAINPNSALAQDKLGTLLTKSGQPAAAIVPLREAVRLQPGYPPFRENLAAALLALHELDESEEQLRGALRIDPGSASARNALGLVYLERGEFSDAIGQFQAALALQPNYPAAAANLQKAADAAKESKGG
jgi:protein O-mannosyl-transferase